MVLNLGSDPCSACQRLTVTLKAEDLGSRQGPRVWSWVTAFGLGGPHPAQDIQGAPENVYSKSR